MAAEAVATAATELGALTRPAMAVTEQGAGSATLKRTMEGGVIRDGLVRILGLGIRTAVVRQSSTRPTRTRFVPALLSIA
jgi:hypothetical protein